MNQSSPFPPDKPPLEPILVGMFVWFGVVLAANGVMIYLALATWNGAVTVHPYEKGLAFNRVIQAQREQEERGIRGEIAWLPSAEPGRGRVVLQLRDPNGAAVANAQVTGTLVRPVATGHDQRFVLKEEAPGSYQAEVAVPLPGIWEIQLEAATGGGNLRFLKRTTAPEGP